MTVKWNQRKLFPVSYGVVHAVIDAVTVTVLFGTILIHQIEPYMGYYLVISYNLLAFGGQAFFGYLSDRLRLTRPMVLAGILLAALGVAFLDVQPLVAVGVVGVGNALFHVGAGALSLYATPGRASAPGIFVGPGALGLGLGTWMGKSGNIFEWPLLVALSVAFVFALFSENPTIPYREKPKRIDVDFPHIIMGLLLFSVAVRSAVGMAGSYDCPRMNWVPPAFATAAFGGKTLGGIISDRIGWKLTSVGALLISAPLIAFLGTSPGALTVGIFFFQMTMPVTLVAIASIIPGRPGFAFGLACLVLILGALPTFYSPSKALFGPALFFTMILLSAASVYMGLHLLSKKVQMKF